jgi:hypothetical protein
MKLGDIVCSTRIYKFNFIDECNSSREVKKQHRKIDGYLVSPQITGDGVLHRLDPVIPDEFPPADDVYMANIRELEEIPEVPM